MELTSLMDSVIIPALLAGPPKELNAGRTALMAIPLHQMDAVKKGPHTPEAMLSGNTKLNVNPKWEPETVMFAEQINTIRSVNGDIRTINGVIAIPCVPTRCLLTELHIAREFQVKELGNTQNAQTVNMSSIIYAMKTALLDGIPKRSNALKNVQMGGLTAEMTIVVLVIQNYALTLPLKQ